MENDVISASDVVSHPVYRFRTGIDEIDWMGGHSTWDDGTVRWGLAVGTAGLWSGERGVGKSRVTTEIAKSASMARNDKGHCFSVVYFCLENAVSIFVEKAKADGTKLPSNLYVSCQRNLEKQIDIIKRVKGQLIFIDSINMVDEYNNGYSDKVVRDVVETYRKVAKEENAHVILISQLNKEGKTKGNTTLPYLVDMEMSIVHSEEWGKGHFDVKVGKKHRFGVVDDKYTSTWEHNKNNVEVVSFNCMKDEFWAHSHGDQVFDVEAEAVKIINKVNAEEERGFLSRFLRG